MRILIRQIHPSEKGMQKRSIRNGHADSRERTKIFKSQEMFLAIHVKPFSDSRGAPPTRVESNPASASALGIVFSNADADNRNQKHLQFPMEFDHFARRGEVTHSGR